MSWVSKHALILLLFGIAGSWERSPSEKVLATRDRWRMQLHSQHQHGMPPRSLTKNWQGGGLTNVHSGGHEVQWRPSIKLRRTIWWQSWRMPTFWPSMQDVLQSIWGISNSPDVYGGKGLGPARLLVTCMDGQKVHSLIWTFIFYMYFYFLVMYILTSEPDWAGRKNKCQYSGIFHDCYQIVDVMYLP